MLNVFFFQNITQSVALLRPKMSIFASIVQQSNVHGDRALALDDPSHTLTYGKIVEESLVIRNELLTRSCARVLLLLPNGRTFVAALLSSTAGSTTFASPCNVLFTPDEVAYQAHVSEADIVLVDTELVSTPNVLARLRETHLVLQAMDPSDVLLKTCTQACRPVTTYALCDDSTALLSFSSGTTGKPKGIPLTHGNITECVNRHIVHDTYIRRDDAVALVLPLFHIYALVPVLLVSLTKGCNVIVIDPRDQNLMNNIIRLAVTVVPTVPNVLTQMATSASQYGSSAALRFVLTAAAPMRASLQSQASQALGVPCCQGYGLTEASCTVTLCMPDTDASQNNKMGSIGRSIVNVCVLTTTAGDDIFSSHTDVVSGADTGEMLVAGPTVMRGYLGLPEETAAVTIVDTETGQIWLRTGDLVSMSSDGFFFIQGRRKEVIKVMGHQVAPSEVEEALLMHEDVCDAGVAGVEDDVAGEIPVAVVVLQRIEGRDTNTMDVLRSIEWRMRETLSNFKRPRKIVVAQCVPRSHSGKIQRHEVVRLCQECTSSHPSTLSSVRDYDKNLVLTHISLILGSAADIPSADTALMDCGLDSIDIVQLCDGLSSALTTSLPATLAFEAPTPNALQRHIDMRFRRGAVDVWQHSGSGSYMCARDDTRSGRQFHITDVGMHLPEGACEGAPTARCSAAGALFNNVPVHWDVSADAMVGDAAQRTQRHALHVVLDRAIESRHGLTDAELDAMSAQQRIVLSTAGPTMDRLEGHVGVRVGASVTDVVQPAHGKVTQSVYNATGSSLSVVAGRLSFMYGLHGSACVYDTACSSSLVAIHAAVSDIDTDAEVAIGVNLMLSPYFGSQLAVAGMLSRSGQCHTFDACADGYLRSETCGCVCIARTTSDDGITGHSDTATGCARIGRCEVRQDGRTANLTAPSGLAQYHLMRNVMNGIECRTVQTHGTGTTLGDPIETASVGRALCGIPSCFQSTKGVFAHAETAAAMASVASLLCNNDVCTNARLCAMNPHVRSVCDASLLFPVQTLRALPSNTTVNSFGFSGTIASSSLCCGTFEEYNTAQQRRTRIARHVQDVQVARTDDNPLLLCTLDRTTASEIARCVNVGRHVVISCCNVPAILPSALAPNGWSAATRRTWDGTSVSEHESAAWISKWAYVLRLCGVPLPTCWLERSVLWDDIDGVIICDELLAGCALGVVEFSCRRRPQVPTSLSTRSLQLNADSHGAALRHRVRWRRLLHRICVAAPRHLCISYGPALWDLFAGDPCSESLPPSVCTTGSASHTNGARMKKMHGPPDAHAQRTCIMDVIASVTGHVAADMVADTSLQLDSLATSELVARLQQLNVVDIDVAAVLHAQTVGNVIDAVLPRAKSSSAIVPDSVHVVSHDAPPSQRPIAQHSSLPCGLSLMHSPADGVRADVMVVMMPNVWGTVDHTRRLAKMVADVSSSCCLYGIEDTFYITGSEPDLWASSTDDICYRCAWMLASFVHRCDCALHLFGSSYGALIVQDTARICPYLGVSVASCILVDPPPPGPATFRNASAYDRLRIATEAVRLGQEIAGLRANYVAAASHFDACTLPYSWWELAVRVTNALSELGVMSFDAETVTRTCRRMRLFEHNLHLWGRRGARRLTDTTPTCTTHLILSSGREKFYREMYGPKAKETPTIAGRHAQRIHLTGDHTTVVQQVCTGRCEQSFELVCSALGMPADE